MGVAARTAAETIVKTAGTTSGGEGTALTRTPGTPASAAAETDLLRDPGGTRRVIVFCSSSDFSRQDNRRRSHRCRKENNQDSSTESASPSRSPAPEQLPAPSLPRPQHLALPTVYHPAPSQPVPENSYTRLSEVSSRPSHREDANRKCYASLGTKSLMKLPTIPFDIADGNSQMNIVNFTASLKEAAAQIRDLGDDFREDGF